MATAGRALSGSGSGGVYCYAVVDDANSYGREVLIGIKRDDDESESEAWMTVTQAEYRLDVLRQVIEYARGIS